MYKLSCELYQRLVKYGAANDSHHTRLPLIKSWKYHPDLDRPGILEVTFVVYEITGEGDELQNVKEYNIDFTKEDLSSDVNMLKKYLQNRLSDYLYKLDRHGKIGELRFYEKKLVKVNTKIENAKKRLKEDYLKEFLKILNSEKANVLKELKELKIEIRTLKKIIENPLNEFKISSYDRNFYISHYCTDGFNQFKNYDNIKEAGE